MRSTVPLTSTADATAAAASLRLRSQALIELERRALPGVFVCLPCWLGVVGLYGLHETWPVGTAIVATLFFLFATGRLMMHRGFAQRVERDVLRTRRVLLALMFANTFLLGTMSGFTFSVTALHPAFLLWSLITGVACAAGTMALAIDRVVWFGFPAATMMPVLAQALVNPTAERLGIAVLVLMFFGYVLKAARFVHDDYWRALRSSELLEERARQLEQLAITDGLTCIANRMHFERRLVDEWARAARHDEPVSVMVIDIDHFKRVNDEHGHPCGDRCLIATAAALRGALYREVDLVARYGGEEFVVLLPDTPAPAAAAVAERLRASVQALDLDNDGLPVPITCSIGVATVMPRVMLDKPSASVAMADSALYRAKADGRNRVVIAPVPEWMQRAAVGSAPAATWRH